MLAVKVFFGVSAGFVKAFSTRTVSRRFSFTEDSSFFIHAPLTVRCFSPMMYTNLQPRCTTAQKEGFSLMKDASKAASLFRAYRDYFKVGSAINSWHTYDQAKADFIRKHFNSITAENEMKPMHVLDRAGTLAIGDGIHTAQDFTRADLLLDFARRNGIKVRFHVLCWHNQTPIWFFTEGWKDIPWQQLREGNVEIPFVSREVMLQRQEAYIRDVMTHVNTCFPGVVYCWDVVNEAIEPDNGAPGCYRTKSPWFSTIGEEFIPAAFRAARKYAAPGQQLYYNDYNCFQPVKAAAILDLLKKLQAEDLVDGMGMQAHLLMEGPSIEECETAARAYGALGLSLQVTELDIHCPDGSEAGQQALADKYAAYFDMLVRLKRDGIDVNSASFWGITDKDSWLPGFRKSESYPLLFTGDLQTKPAFDAVVAVPARYDLIRLNQCGYAEGLPQTIAVVSDQPVVLRDAAGAVLKTFQPEPTADEASGEAVAAIGIGPLTAGTYTLTCGPDTRTFTVSKQPWRDVTNALVKGLYYQRCGTALEAKHAGIWAHAACHTRAARLWEDKRVALSVPGGWHDAGDYGKYVTPGAVSAAHLMYTWLLFPQGCGDVLNIPESGNGVPDILNEARWELDWMLRMQRADGAVYHKLTKDHFAPFIMPEQDQDQEYVLPVSSLATADAAAAFALASRIWLPYDAAYAEALLASAIRAWGWLEQHPEFVFENQQAVRTGAYWDRGDRDERFWAACELYAATRDAQYLRAAEALYIDEMNVAQFGWGDVSGMGALCCLFVLKEDAGALTERIRQNMLNRAGFALESVRLSGCGTAIRPHGYGWGSILPVMGNAITLIAAHLLTGDTVYRDAALNQLNYALGLNALGMSFVTGFGTKRVMYPHHRPSGADGIIDPVPGLISGGPNIHRPFPATRAALAEDVAPAKAFLDETHSADTNEIAIYWNTAAVIVFAYFNALTAE